MRLKFLLVILGVFAFLFPAFVGASIINSGLETNGNAGGVIVFQTTDFITGIEGVTYEFIADVESYTYQATLSDLCFGPLEFAYIGLSVSTASETLGCTDGPGSFIFKVTPNATYFANVFGVGKGEYDTGLYGLKVDAVPIPTTLLLLNSGLVGLVELRRRVN